MSDKDYGIGNREIKFRAWCKIVKTMYEWSEVDFINEDEVGISDGDQRYSLDDVILLQYTGLKDKNGKEIYEGDIYKEQVVWAKDPQVFIAKIPEIYGTPSAILSGYGKNRMVHAEIIGNIFENPELLTKQQ